MRLSWISAALLAFAKDVNFDTDDVDQEPEEKDPYIFAEAMAPAPAPRDVHKEKPPPVHTPPVHTPPIKPPVAEPVHGETEENIRRRLMQEKVDSTLRSLAGQPGSQKGAWLYADYKQDGSTASAVECAQLCESDVKCYHWNFQVDNTHCDLKNNNGGYYSNDHTNWVTGSSSRAKRGGEL
eukprot:GEMP01022392.1.p1 GENE.GEMP01022392.1~~GEMP01022392.1.p1  ORF type:complete len:181 (-),score=49.36 GEMP01022392.1:1900-2442(-)